MNITSSIISVDTYDYLLPEKKIALYPARSRDLSKLLCYDGSRIIDAEVSLLPEMLDNGMLMVFNNSRVIRARLYFRKPTGALIEVFCLEPLLPSSELQTAMLQKETTTWKCLVGNAARWKSGELLSVLHHKGQNLHLRAEISSRTNEAFYVNFKWTPSTFTFSEVLEAAGKIPLPPYIKRDAELLDAERYQTVYSKSEGSVAAPTAGLHFTPELFRKIKKKGIDICEVTLHVGAGTFRPLISGNINEHIMHQEQVSVDFKLIEKLYNAREKIIAVGTTSVRTLESLYYLGIQVIEKGVPENVIGQWDPYLKKSKINGKQSLEALLNFMIKADTDKLNFHTRIIIMPSYKFRITDGIFTNFHQPRSTLLLLIAAYLGDDWKKVYHHALNNHYRFLSYGDACLFLK